MKVDAATKARLEHLETDRLKMDRIKESDAPRVYELQSSPGMEQETVVKTFEQTRAAIQNWSDTFEDEGLTVYTLTTKEDNFFVGTAGLGIAPYYAPHKGSPELCHSRIFAHEQNKGYISEARKRLISVAFDDLGLDTLKAQTANPIQVRGYIREGFTHQENYPYSEQWPVVQIWSLSKKDYIAKKQLLPVAELKLETPLKPARLPFENFYDGP